MSVKLRPMTAAEAIRRLTALTTDATAAADRPDAALQRADYERLREEALRLNRDGGWSTDELIVSLLPSLRALDEIAALETAYSTGDDRQAGPEVSVDATRVEALLRDLAGWATGVRSAYEFVEDARRGD
jgi:hypothetical protein